MVLLFALTFFTPVATIEKIKGGMRIVYRVTRDGNCLFSYISKFFFGNENVHRQVRKHIGSYMARYRDYFEIYVVDEDVFDIHLKNMSSTSGSR